MQKVLIVTRKDDPHADLVIDELHILGAEVFRLNTEAITEYSISLGMDGGTITNLAHHRELDLSEVGSVYLRRRSYPQNPDVAEEHKEFAQGEWVKMMRNIWACLDDRFWINRPLAIENAKDKIRQLRIARNAGFLVPKTLMSNSLDSVRAFRSGINQLAYKAFDGGALYPGAALCVYTTLLGAEHLGEDQRSSIRVCPGIFQEYHNKEYELRVTIVGDEFLAVRIDSQLSIGTGVDWRKGDLLAAPHTHVVLDDECKRKCLIVMRELGLVFGGMDLIRTPEGEYVFLEVNANGQWAWLEGMSGAPIARAIASSLVRNMRNPS